MAFLDTHPPRFSFVMARKWGAAFSRPHPVGVQPRGCCGDSGTGVLGAQHGFVGCWLWLALTLVGVLWCRRQQWRVTGRTQVRVTRGPHREPSGLAALPGPGGSVPSARQCILLFPTHTPGHIGSLGSHLHTLGLGSSYPLDDLF